MKSQDEINKKYWWFGINNLKERKEPSCHVVYSDIEGFLKGRQEVFRWPYGGLPYSRKFYNEIKKGDEVILWMGHGWFEHWGILGFASVIDIEKKEKIPIYVLDREKILDSPLTPYKKQYPQETEYTTLLRDVFGVSFKALGDVFYKVGYISKRTTPVTIDQVSFEQYLNIFKTCNEDTLLKEQNDYLPKELIEKNNYTEGTKKQIQTTTYERSRGASTKCLDYYGATCQVCSFNFEKKYGRKGRGIIHVHHRKPIAEIGDKYALDPIQDLLPVCPNCHTFIHSKDPAYMIEEVIALLAENEIEGRR